ncbi:hypothetical protein BHM03_00059948 [Ensete ventricosum]|nr:hypothetical protein BHM03_00059948 [Ensete ventricosum]
MIGEAIASLRIEQLGEEKLVPGVLEARQAPVDAVCVAHRIGDLLRGRRHPLLLVDGRVGVLAVAGELGDVEDCDGQLRSADHVPDHLHDALPAVGAPVRGVFDHGCLVVAVASGFGPPVSAPVGFSVLISKVKREGEGVLCARLHDIPRFVVEGALSLPARLNPP